jgi:hypothetical protein
MILQSTYGRTTVLSLFAVPRRSQQHMFTKIEEKKKSFTFCFNFTHLISRLLHYS